MTLLLAMLAGVMATLSPCVLPVLPFVAKGSLSVSRKGPLVIGLGMILSFAVVGTSLLAFGNLFGFGEGQIRNIAAVIIVLAGLTYTFSFISDGVSKVLTPLGSKIDGWSHTKNMEGLTGQFFLGTLIGFIWSPCTGPTMGVAIGLAAQEETRLIATSILVAFGIGAVTPLMGAAYATQRFLANKGKLMEFSQKMKTPMGIIFILLGISIFFSLDKAAEAWILSVLPQSWINMTVQF